MSHTMQSNHYLIRLLLIVATVATTTLTASADIDKKYYKKVAEKIWASEMPGFDPNVELTDSIYQGQNGVFIARYNGITADYNNDNNPTKKRYLGIPNNNVTKLTHLRRIMVKINDAAAAEDFTEFSVSPDRKIDFHGHVFYSRRNSFGARIIKPDGTINDVDINEVLTQKGGKKDKEDAVYKIAIPGLQAGDVLDYFYQSDYFADEKSLDEFNVNILAKYPTHLFTLDVKVDPRLCVEYGAYNGAPRITSFPKTDDGKNLLFLQLENVHSLDESIPYFSAARQMPMMEIYILNNNKPRLDYVPDMHRPSGMRVANFAFVLRDIAYAIFNAKPDDKVVNEAHSILKNWSKAHPDATPEQTTDAAWVALRYVLLKSQERHNSRTISKMFYKLLEKMDSFTDARIAVSNSRRDVNIKEIANFNDPDYFVMVGKRTYFPGNPYTLPGEIPEDYDGEDYVLFSARPDNNKLHQSVKYGKFPNDKPISNTIKVISKATINPENPEQIDVESESTLTGTVRKFMATAITDLDYIGAIERFLNVKPDKIKHNGDKQEIEEKTREDMEERVKDLWGSEEAKLDSFKLIRIGLLPDSTETIVKVNGNIPGLISQAGNNLMVKVGSLIGKQMEVKGNQRKRDVSILLSSPYRTDQTILFEIPDGYELVEESLEDLRRSVITPVGAFNSDVTIEGNQVKIRVTERYARSIYPETLWDEMLKVIDASAAFTGASIVLRPKK